MPESMIMTRCGRRGFFMWRRSWAAFSPSQRWRTTSATHIVKNPIVGQESKNPQLREWHTKNLGRLPGLKFMRTLWVCEVSGGPFKFAATKPGATSLGLEEAHRDLKISPAEFDEVAAELGRTLDFFKVPKKEKDEVLGAFAAHKDEVTAGSVAAPERG